MQIRVVVPMTGKILTVIPIVITNDNFLGVNPSFNRLDSELIIFLFQGLYKPQLLNKT